MNADKHSITSCGIRYARRATCILRAPRLPKSAETSEVPDTALPGRALNRQEERQVSALRPRLAPGRLYEVPVALGLLDRVLDEDDLTPMWLIAAEPAPDDKQSV